MAPSQKGAIYVGKDLRGKELGVNLSQDKRGYYVARFVDRFGKRVTKRFKKIHDCKKWLADAQFENDSGSMTYSGNMIVDVWYDKKKYCIELS